MLKKRNIEDLANPLSQEGLELLPSQKILNLKPDEKISLKSIFSALFDHIEPPENQLLNLQMPLPAKYLINKYPDISFEEHLYISKLENNDCKALEEKRIFMENELQEIGTFKLNIEESSSGFEVYAESKMLKGKKNICCGHRVKGKYDKNFTFISEKRKEYDFVDNARIEKILDARLLWDQLIVKRESRINNESQCFKAVINVKDRTDVFIFDGGVLLLVRYLITNKFRGDFNYYSMNSVGKVIHCKLTVFEELEQIIVNHRTFKNALHVRNTQYFNNYPQEISQTFYTDTGKMILHFWHNFDYIIHETKGYVPKHETIVPKLEFVWHNQKQLLDQYHLKKQLNYENALAYFDKHPELTDFLHDFILNVLKHKPRNILEFAIDFFQKFKKPPINGV